MDRMRITLLAKVAGGAAIGSLLMYGGSAMGRPGVSGSQATLWTLVGLGIAVAGLWGLSELGGRRLAGWVALVATGLAPLTAFFGWMLADATPGGITAGLLWLNLLTGVAAVALVAWSILQPAEGVGAGRRRVLRA